MVIKTIAAVSFYHGIAESGIGTFLISHASAHFTMESLFS